MSNGSAVSAIFPVQLDQIQRLSSLIVRKSAWAGDPQDRWRFVDGGFRALDDEV